MKRYDYQILRFKIDGLCGAEVQELLSQEGAKGFKIVNSHIYAPPEARNGAWRYMFFVM